MIEFSCKTKDFSRHIGLHFTPKKVKQYSENGNHECKNQSGDLDDKPRKKMRFPHATAKQKHSHRVTPWMPHFVQCVHI